MIIGMGGIERQIWVSGCDIAQAWIQKGEQLGLKGKKYRQDNQTV